MRAENYGGIKYIGASISDEKLLDQAVDQQLLNDLDVVQMPGRLFMKRYDLVEKIKKMGIEIVVNAPISKNSGEIGPAEVFEKLLGYQDMACVLTGATKHFDEVLGYVMGTFQPAYNVQAEENVRVVVPEFSMAAQHIKSA